MKLKTSILIALCCAIFAMPMFSHAEIIEQIVAIVNEDIVTKTDMDKYQKRLRSGGLTDDLLFPDEKTKQESLNDRNKLLQKMIDEKVIDSEVKRQKLEVPIERVEQEIRSIAKRNDMSRDDLKKAVEEKGVTFAQYQDFIKTGLERQSLIEKAITSKIKISEDDVAAQYASQNGEDNSQIFEYSLEHILFLTKKVGVEKAKERAEMVEKKLKAGEDFEKMAGEYSEDPNYTTGGVLGTFKTGEFLKELEVPVQKMAVGDISNPIETSAGIHILKLVKKRLIPDPKLEKEKDKIRNVLYEKAYKKQFQSWLEQIRQDSFIRINIKT